jgi:hypothetical protein
MRGKDWSGRHERRLLKGKRAADKVAIERVFKQLVDRVRAGQTLTEEDVRATPMSEAFKTRRMVARARDHLARTVWFHILRYAPRVKEPDREALARRFNESGAVATHSDGSKHVIKHAKAEEFGTFQGGIDYWRYRLGKVEEALVRHGEYHALFSLAEVIFHQHYISTAVWSKEHEDQRMAGIRERIKTPTNRKQVDAVIEKKLPDILSAYRRDGGKDKGFRHAARQLYPLLRRKSLWQASEDEQKDIGALRKHLERHHRKSF